MMELLQYEFMRNALLAGLLASVACGIIGTYVVVKRIVMLSGGISHAAYGGIGLGYYLGINPVVGAIGFSLGMAMGMGWLSRRRPLRTDTIIGIMWAMGMALGVILIELSPGYSADLMGYLFGSILAVSPQDIIIMAVLDGIIMGTVLLLYKELLALSFDEEFAAVVGVPVEGIYFLLLALIALTVVMLMKVVGLILVIALLSIPASISSLFTSSMKRMISLSILLGMVFTTGGLLISFFLDLPAGATIILVAGGAFLITHFLLRGS